MGTPVAQRLVDEAEYLAVERETDVRHEYVDGVLFAMVGASRRHNLLSTRLSARLFAHLDGGPCRVTSSDMKVRLAEGRRYYYPDLLVSRSDPAAEPDEYTETQPSLIVEILSDSTEQTDRREKLVAYRSIPSLVDYLIVSQTEPAVEHFSRDGESWARAAFGPGESVALDSVGFVLEVDDPYAGVLV